MLESTQARALRWAGLVGLSGLGMWVLSLLQLPAAPLLGAMGAAVLLATRGTSLAVPWQVFQVAQAVVGCMVARAIPATVLGDIAKDWPIFLAGILSVIAASALLGWLLARAQVLPGTTAVWGSSPGAAVAMTVMAESYGADVRLVAFMQYLRVVIVAVCATIVARIWLPEGAASASHPDWFPPVAWGPFAGTLLLILLGTLASRVRRLPSGPLLVPLFLGSFLQDTRVMRIELPSMLLLAAYAFIGWSIGLRFNRTVVRHAARALPRVLLAVLSLIALCGVLAALLVVFAGVDPLTAYLATSPGGADSIAIIAANSQVDVAFVMAMQTTRFIIVMLSGPSIARFIANRTGVARPQ